MALVIVSTAAAATIGASLYLNAKYAIVRDVFGLLRLSEMAKGLEAAAKEKRVSVYYTFEATAKRIPNADCIWSRAGSYTYQQTYNAVHRYAQWCLGKGVKPGDLVCFYMMNSAEFIIAWMALLAIGAAPSMINYNLKGKALIHCLKLSKSKLLIVDDEADLLSRIEVERAEIEGQLGMVVQVLNLDTKQTIAGLKTERPENSFRDGVTPSSPLCLFYTSGTTGMPKAVSFLMSRAFEVNLSHTVAARSSADPLQRSYVSKPLLETDRWYTCMPLYHGTGGTAAIGNLSTGITCCVGKKFSTTTFWDDVRDSRATWITYVGETARYLLAAPPSPLDKVHNVRVMYGNGLRPDVWIKFRERFGVPEVVEFFNSSEGVFGLANYCRGDYLAGSVGFHGGLLRLWTRNLIAPVLVDEATGAVARHPTTGFAFRQPYEKGGEILVAVPAEAEFAGYHNNPEATAKKFERNVFKKGDLWYRSGDNLRRTADGRWLFVDRLGDTFRWKGENVSTAEVAAVLGKYPGVVEANVYGVALPSHDGRAGCAAVYLEPSQATTFDYADFLRYSRTHLPRYAVPIFMRIVSQMTPIHNNKQNKVPLREEGVDPAKVKPEDRILWVDEQGRGNTYVEFKEHHWQQLVNGKARL